MSVAVRHVVALEFENLTRVLARAFAHSGTLLDQGSRTANTLIRHRHANNLRDWVQPSTRTPFRTLLLHGVVGFKMFRTEQVPLPFCGALATMEFARAERTILLCTLFELNHSEFAFDDDPDRNLIASVSRSSLGQTLRDDSSGVASAPRRESAPRLIKRASCFPRQAPRKARSRRATALLCGVR